MGTIIGRKEELEILNAALKSRRPELIVMYGRRRIGKTYLVREAYRNYIRFEFSGTYQATFKEQLKNFDNALAERKFRVKKSASWIDAFHQLGRYMNTVRSSRKKVIFIDEFPWLDTRRSGFLRAFDYFWNSYVSKRNDVVVVVCGSAASYMIKHIIRSKGGLHNRLTQQIRLSPFNLAETEQMLKRNGIRYSRYEILQLYMATGGVPHYLEMLKPGESVAQTIDRLCFSKNGFLRAEFTSVFASLFEQYDNHESIMRTLAKVRKGMTRNAILKNTKMNSGGTLTQALEELEQSGFIEKYLPYQGVKDAIYRLTDEYSLFYIRFIEGTKPGGKQPWMKIQGQQAYKIWAGFGYETICLKHLEQIKEALRIGGITATYGSWLEKNGTHGAQIDLLIDRDDNVINVCEIKFWNGRFLLDKKYAGEIASKVDAFAASTKTKKSVFVTFITTYGMTDNAYRRSVVQNELTMDDLFVDI